VVLYYKNHINSTKSTGRNCKTAEITRHKDNLQHGPLSCLKASNMHTSNVESDFSQSRQQFLSRLS